MLLLLNKPVFINRCTWPYRMVEAIIFHQNSVATSIDTATKGPNIRSKRSCWGAHFGAVVPAICTQMSIDSMISESAYVFGPIIDRASFLSMVTVIGTMDKAPAFYLPAFVHFRLVQSRFRCPLNISTPASYRLFPVPNNPSRTTCTAPVPRR